MASPGTVGPVTSCAALPADCPLVRPVARIVSTPVGAPVLRLKLRRPLPSAGMLAIREPLA